MTAEQFALWLQGYLSVHVFQSTNFGMRSGMVVDVQKMGDEVLAAARCVVRREVES